MSTLHSSKLTDVPCKYNLIYSMEFRSPGDLGRAPSSMCTLQHASFMIALVHSLKNVAVLVLSVHNCNAKIRGQEYTGQKENENEQLCTAYSTRHRNRNQ